MSSTATRPSSGCSSGPGSQRADMVIAVTGDDEDNMLICQVAQGEVPGRPDHRPGQQPAQPPALRPAWGSSPSVSATDLILRLIEHEVPEYGLVHLLDLPEERLEIIEMLLGEDAKVVGRGWPIWSCRMAAC